MKHQVTIQINDLFIRRSLIVVLGIWSLLVFFPGSYSVDSWNQYNQMIHNDYNDWHAPILPFFWHILYVLTGKYYTLFIVQIGLYWLFVGLLLANILINRIVFISGILLAVFFLFIPQYIMKDTQHAISWGLSVLLVIQANKTPGRAKKKWLHIFSMLFMIYGLYIRINAVVALIPILLIWLNSAIPIKGVFKKTVIITSVISVLLVGNYVINYKLLKASKEYPEYKWKLLDVAGISKLSGHNYLPKEVTSYPAFNYDTLFSLYTPASLDDIYWPKSGQSIFPMPDKGLYKAVSQSWNQACMDHPILYLKNRCEGYLYYLRLNHRFPKDQYWNAGIWIDPNNPIGLVSVETPPKNLFMRVYGLLNVTSFFDPWLWVLINFILCVIFLIKYLHYKAQELIKIQALVQLSGILFILSQLLIYQHDRDFRYTYWNVFTCLVGFIYLLRLHVNAWKDVAPILSEKVSQGNTQ